MSHYQSYKAQFEKRRSQLRAPADCSVGVPSYRALGDFVDPKSWDFSWWLEFSDGHYVVCHEIWSYRPGRSPTRQFFSFHYGPIVKRSANGEIDRNSQNPVVLRICKNSREPIHLHFKLPHPNPHYEQNQIGGLTLEDVDMFQFIGAVFRSRSEGIEMDQALGFTVR